MKAEPYITKVIFVLKKGLIWSKNNTKNKITIETLNSYVFLIYVAWLSDQRVNDFMQLRLFPRHLNVVHSKWQQRNKMSSQEEVADVAAWRCLHSLEVPTSAPVLSRGWTQIPARVV